MLYSIIDAFEKMEPPPKAQPAEEKAEAKGEEKEGKGEKSPRPDESKPQQAKDGGVDKEEMKKDPKFSKYFKMVAVGVAKGNVYSKMASEGLSPEDVEKFR